ncbi:MAG: hypothetical protein P4M11_07150 [Candidatus Pacebacteria bacterium]|nr:hypothetical protein [Candidatus Paceibacterota bacterium]
MQVQCTLVSMYEPLLMSMYERCTSVQHRRLILAQFVHHLPLSPSPSVTFHHHSAVSSFRTRIVMSALPSISAASVSSTSSDRQEEEEIEGLCIKIRTFLESEPAGPRRHRDIHAMQRACFSAAASSPKAYFAREAKVALKRMIDAGEIVAEKYPPHYIFGRHIILFALAQDVQAAQADPANHDSDLVPMTGQSASIRREWLASCKEIRRCCEGSKQRSAIGSRAPSQIPPLFSRAPASDSSNSVDINSPPQQPQRFSVLRCSRRIHCHHSFSHCRFKFHTKLSYAHRASKSCSQQSLL